MKNLKNNEELKKEVSLPHLQEAAMLHDYGKVLIPDKILNKAGYEYYTLNNPTITDQEYDSLMDELINLETGVKLDGLTAVNPITGKPVVETDNKKRILYYLKGTEPTGEEMVFDELYEE